MSKQIPIALQLFSLRTDCAERGLPAVLKDVSDIGYAGVEFAGLHGLSALEIRKHLDDTGLQVAGTHTPIAALLGDELEKTIEINQQLGNRYIIVPSLPEEYRDSIDTWKKTAELFNQWAERLAREEMLIGYHNHKIEFEPMDGVYPWDVFYGNTGQEVIMQLDTGNALAAGVDVAPFIDKYPHRAITVHLKEYSGKESSAIIGEGETGWNESFRLCEGIGSTEWYIVEQESYAYPPLECVKRCLHNLRGMLS